MKESQSWALDIAFGIGMSVAGAASAAGLSREAVWVEWSRRTGLPCPWDPTPSVIRARAKEVRRGWTADVRAMAAAGITLRPQSSVVGYRMEVRRARFQRWWSGRAARGAETGSTSRAEHHDSGEHGGGGRGGHGPFDEGREGEAPGGCAPGAGDLSVGTVGEAAAVA